MNELQKVWEIICIRIGSWLPDKTASFKDDLMLYVREKYKEGAENWWDEESEE